MTPTTAHTLAADAQHFRTPPQSVTATFSIPATTSAVTTTTTAPTPATGQSASHGPSNTTPALTIPTLSDVDPGPTCLHCGRTILSGIVLVGVTYEPIALRPPHQYQEPPHTLAVSAFAVHTVHAH
ncbi:hypothetical protein SprV_0200851500 [Sparganum proliferum]